MAKSEEMKSLQKNKIWDLVELPKGRLVVGCKWIFKKKYGSPTKEVIRYKACLVAKGYNKKNYFCGLKRSSLYAQKQSPR